eukprot:jgi/Mesen1/1923/ME000145S01008
MTTAAGVLGYGSARNWGGTDDPSNSSRRSFSDVEIEDEEALRWAALERLPTYDRLRSSVLKDLEGVEGQGHVDLGKLTGRQRMVLVERALATEEQDNELLLSRLLGIELPTVEVRYQKLSVEADVFVGNRALPTLWNFTRDIFETLVKFTHLIPSSRRPFPILHNVSGTLKPHRLTLLLGPPGAGKTTLLLALAGKLNKELRREGKVTYNGHELHEFIPARTAAYISQSDDHIGTLTVRETLDFSARCQGTSYRHDLIKELEQRERAAGITPDPNLDAFLKAASLEGRKHSVVTDYITKVLGLDVCADTLVGNEMLRGISGGQKKRVTTGEMIVGPTRTLFMDEISTGLDSSTTFQIVKCIRNFCHIFGGTVLMALLQPAPETFELFDDILLLSDGHVVYHGPREHVTEFFESMGFRCPERKGIADFLQEVTSRKDQQQYWVGAGSHTYVPVTAFADAFQSFHVGRASAAELAVLYERERSHPAALVREKYGVGKLQLFRACIEREALLMRRDAFLYVFKTVQVAVLAFITATLFFRTTLSPNSVQDANVYMGALFFSLVHMMFNGFAEMAITVSRLRVFYKQRDNLLYPAWAFSIPTWVLRLPYSVVEAVLWTGMVYYVVGFAPEAGRFFRYMLVMFMIHQMAIGLFRFIGALGRSMVIANTFGSFSLLVVFLLGGFIIAKPNIHPWWIWGYWVSPLQYGQNAIAINEFGAPRWQKLTAPAGGGGGSLGNYVLQSRGLFTQGWYFWLAMAALLAYMFIFYTLVTIALQYMKPIGGAQVVLSEDAISEKHANRTGAASDAAGAAATSNQKKRKQRKMAGGNMASGRTAPVAAAQGERKDEEVQVAAMEEGRLAQQQGGGEVTKGMILPFQPLALTFHNVNYYVDMPPEMRQQGFTESKLQLLRNVSGAFRPGVLTALVGVSGAGKTTLMDVLAGRKTGGYIEGDIRVSGFPKVQETFARVAGYCEQTDVHSPQVTVEESLIYSAWLRLPASVPASTRQEFVEEVMALVELAPLRGALVGLPGATGLSTEQRKRLTIAVELVANPSIIFMDEPTSGLDARAAAIVMRAVRNTVDTGRTVVCTIHQPSIDIFEAFDELLLMKRGGQCTYSGPLGYRSSVLVDYFQSIEGVPPIKEGYNPATWMLEISTPAYESRIGADFAEIFRKSQVFRDREVLIEQLSVPEEGVQDLAFPTKYSQSFATQFVASLWKKNRTYWRTPQYKAMNFFFTLVCALIFGSIFWNLGGKRSTQQEVFNVMGALYAAVLFIGVNNSSTVQPVISVERTVFWRERAAGMYSPIPYALAQGVIEFPYVIVQTIMYGAITYAMIQFEWTAPKFFWYLFFMFLTFMYFTFFGMITIALTPNQQLAAVISSFFYSLWNLFSGFLIPRPSIPGWWVWFYWINPIAWTLYGLIASQLGNVSTPFTLQTGQVTTVKSFIESYFGFHHDWLGYCAAVLCGFVALLWAVFALGIKYLNYQKR